MQKTKTSIILILITTAVFFAGCLNYDQITVIKSDGSGDMYLHCWMKLYPEYDSLNLTRFKLFNEDSLRNIFSSKFTDIDKIIVYKDQSDSTFHSKVELSFTSLDSLNRVRGFRNLNYSLTKGPDNTIIFSQSLNPFPVGYGISRGDEQISYTYYLPGEIIRHNATKQKKNKLEWIFRSDEIARFQTLTATYKPFKLKETPSWIYYLALSVLLIVIVFLFRGKKR